MPDLFPNTREHRADTGGAEIFARIGGSGPPLLLLHGYPQTHAMWHNFTVHLAMKTYHWLFLAQPKPLEPLVGSTNAR